MYRLYTFPYSQHSRRVVSLLEQVGIPYENQVVDMMQGMHLQPEYADINPNCQVPTLIDGSLKIHESNAILRYLCTQHHLDNWYPAESRLRAQIEQWLDWTQCRLSPLVVSIVLNSVFLKETGNQNVVQEAKVAIAERWDYLEQALENRMYLVADRPTIADLALASNLFQLSLAEAMPQTPNILRWYHGVSALPGFQKSLPVTEP